MQENAVRLQDVAKACDTHPTRVSEALTALGVGPGRVGRRGSTVSLADAIRVAAARRLIDLGMGSGAALDIARQIQEQDLVRMIADDRRTWIAVGTDPAETSRFVFSLLRAEDLLDLAEAVRGGGIRLVNLYGAAHEILAAALERKQAASAKEPTTVTKFTADPRVSGAVVEDLGSGIGLAVVRHGKGHRLTMSPAEARALGERLIAAAEEHGDAPPENMN